jgi:hypothetical protein
MQTLRKLAMALFLVPIFSLLLLSAILLGAGGCLLIGSNQLYSLNQKWYKAYQKQYKV